MGYASQLSMARLGAVPSTVRRWAVKMIPSAHPAILHFIGQPLDVGHMHKCLGLHVMPWHIHKCVGLHAMTQPLSVVHMHCAHTTDVHTHKSGHPESHT